MKLRISIEPDDATTTSTYSPDIMIDGVRYKEDYERLEGTDLRVLCLKHVEQVVKSVDTATQLEQSIIIDDAIAEPAWNVKASIQDDLHEIFYYLGFTGGNSVQAKQEAK